MVFLILGLKGILFWVDLVFVAVIGAALIDMLARPKDAFVAADKQTKPFWVMALVLSFALGLVGIVAGIAYFLDVRPALEAVGGKRGGPSSTKPDGPAKR